MLRNLLLLFGLTLCPAVCLAEQEPQRQQQAFSPEESRQQIVVAEDCRVELVASEPDVIDPVAMAFDPQGRLWVVEYSDYPHGPESGQPGRSRVRILTDSDGDGRYSNARIFADGLLFANGIQLFRDGAIITANGSILFLRDTDGDGRADEQQVWFRGFATENSQLRCSHPTLAMDGWISVTNGLRGGLIAPGESNPWGLDPQSEPLSISGRDFRFHPLTGEREAVSGVGQFGISFDNHGNRFVCDNRHPCRQVLIEEADIRAAPWLRIPRVLEDVSPAGDQSRLFPISRAWTTSHLHANQFTAACGLLIYRGDRLPETCRDHSFVCDPTANLIHRDRLVPGRVTFSAAPAEDVEFLASRDEWFRPVNLTHGPDGSLYVCDMYRAVIEHPEFMPEELRTRPDLMLGIDLGRIWRIRENGSGPVEMRLFPAQGEPEQFREQLVGWLDHDNSWHRETAFRLLMERGEPETAIPLRALLRDPESRWGAALALRLLDLLEVLNTEDLISGLNHPYAARQALQLRRLRFPEDEKSFAVLSSGLASRNDEIDPHRWVQALLATRWSDWSGLPDGGQTFHGEALQDLAAADRREAPFLRAILALHAGTQLSPLLQQVLSGLDSQEPSREMIAMLGELSRAIARRNDPEQLTDCLRTLLAAEPQRMEEVRSAALAGFLEGLPGGADRLRKLLPDLPSETQAVFRSLLVEVGAAVEQPDSDPDRHRDRLLLLQLLPVAAALPILEQQTHNPDPARVSAAVDVLRKLRGPGVDTQLMDLLPQATPRLRRELIPALCDSPPRMELLLQAVESGTVSPLELDRPLQQRLLKHPDASWVARARSLFETSAAGDRQRIIADYQPCLELPADPHRGRVVFEKNCAMCHKIGGLGVNVAPDISDSRVTTPAALLTNILDPNRAIDNNYFSFTIVDVAGRIHTGVISAETATSVTLLQPEGKTVTLAREEIDMLQNNRVSLMPDGLERTITKQEMADLISFIKNWRYLDGQVPPEVIRQN